ncbi:hypothetical protein PR202_gb29694 [Eleusine coracana subsp. coracana]|uniref:Uncharacterized protein n=1 Tax=Eleusine coracana subsp. coracana TaxID=191504 RepID=A0AAV5FXT4_ELECO|nr:hypothetical protein PR202_gb29694 [Eleusine coracana subsp. coracana]
MRPCSTHGTNLFSNVSLSGEHFEDFSDDPASTTMATAPSCCCCFAASRAEPPSKEEHQDLRSTPRATILIP